MILSASDIYALLTRDPILGTLGTIRIIDRRPPLEAGNGVYIYIKKYPTVQDFEATWNIWIVDYDEDPLDVVIGQIKRLLPRFTILEGGAIIKATTTELRADRTEIEPLPARPELAIPTVEDLDSRFEDLRQSIEDRMLLVGPGRAGKDGARGVDGRDGRDGKDGIDVIATEARLNDLKDVYTSNAKTGNVLTFDGSDWVAKNVQQVFRSGGVSTGSGSTSMPEPPDDGKFYVRTIGPSGGEWVDLLTAIQALNLDAGNFDGP